MEPLQAWGPGLGALLRALEGDRAPRGHRLALSQLYQQPAYDSRGRVCVRFPSNLACCTELVGS